MPKVKTVLGAFYSGIQRNWTSIAIIQKIHEKCSKLGMVSRGKLNHEDPDQGKAETTNNI